MPSLVELQRDFAEAVFGTSPGPFMSGLVSGRDSVDRVFGVYRSSILGNYRKALAAVYPVVERLVGERFFAQAAGAFACRTPSRHGDLNCFGAEFAEFLTTFPGADRLAYLPDVARLEWAVEGVFNAADPAPPPPGMVEAVLMAADGESRFTLAPHCRLLRSPWPVDRLWALNQPDVPWDDAFRIDSGAVALLVRRQEFAVEIERLSGAECDLLEALAAGASLAFAFSGYGQAEMAQLGAFLGRRLALGDLVSV